MKLRKLIIASTILLITTSTYSQSVTFNVKTVTYNGKYAPANCFALWITNASGVYVKTINRQSATYTQYLTYWKASSGTKLTDGMTGATIESHNEPYNGTVSRIPFVWNCTDYNETLVANGNYYVNVEFTEINGTGKYIRYLFTKGDSNQDLTFANATYFTNATLSYKVPASAISEEKIDFAYKLLYNKAQKTLQIKNSEQILPNTNIMIYSSKGIRVFNNQIPESGTNLGLSNYSVGVYIVKIIEKNKTVQTQKILIN
jgi:hypothetical protein